MRVWQTHDPSIARVPMYLGPGHAELFAVTWQQLIPRCQQGRMLCRCFVLLLPQNKLK